MALYGGPSRTHMPFRRQASGRKDSTFEHVHSSSSSSDASNIVAATATECCASSDPEEPAAGSTSGNVEIEDACSLPMAPTASFDSIQAASLATSCSARDSTASSSHKGGARDDGGVSSSHRYRNRYRVAQTNVRLAVQRLIPPKNPSGTVIVSGESLKKHVKLPPGIIRPGTRRKNVWDVWIAILIIYSILFVPLRVGFAWRSCVFEMVRRAAKPVPCPCRDLFISALAEAPFTRRSFLVDPRTGGGTCS